MLTATLEPISEETLKPYSNCEHLFMTTRLVRKHNASNPQEIKYTARGCGDGSVFRNIWNDNYSPTVNSVTLSIIQNLSLIYNLLEYSVDTVGAYLYQDYPTSRTPLVVTLEPRVSQSLSLDPKQRYRLRKYIYGLPNSGQAYYNALSELLQSSDYTQCPMDPCLFYKHSSGGSIFICFHVDDAYIATSNHQTFTDFTDCISNLNSKSLYHT